MCALSVFSPSLDTHHRWFSKHSWTSSTSGMLWYFTFLPHKCCLRRHSWVCPTNNNICFIWSLSCYLWPKAEKVPRDLPMKLPYHHPLPWRTPMQLEYPCGVPRGHNGHIEVHLILVHFTVLHRCCLLQIEDKALHQQKDYNGLYCGGLKPSTQYLWGVPVV